MIQRKNAKTKKRKSQLKPVYNSRNSISYSDVEEASESESESESGEAAVSSAVEEEVDNVQSEEKPKKTKDELVIDDPSNDPYKEGLSLL